MTYLLGALLVLVLPAFVVQTFLGRKDNRETMSLRDLLEQEREQHTKTRGELAVETAAHDVTSKQLEAERTLRAVTEANLNEAMRRYSTLLRTHLKEATDDEIRAATAAAFSDFGSVPPLPKASRAEADGLVDPFAEVPPT